MVPPQHNPVPLQHDVVPPMMDLSYIKWHKKLNSSNFTGVFTFEEVEYWLAGTEKVFVTLRVILE